MLDKAKLAAEIQTSFQGKEVLVTGGLGFIGSNVSQALVDLGAKVSIFDALLPPYGGNQFNIAEIKDQVNLIDGDIRNRQQLTEAIKDQDYIFHFAGQISYLDSKEQPLADLEANGQSNLTILEAVREHAPKAKILFSSSRLVYGKIMTTPVTEEHPTNPLSLYGIHKLLGEKYYRYYAQNFGVHGVSVRIPNPYGPRQQMKHSKYSIVGWFVRQALENKELTVFGDGSQERDYIYIDDIVDACLRLITLGEAGEVYNVGSHERLRFVDMVDHIIAAVGQGQKKHVPWPEDYEKNETGDYIADTTKIKTCCGWEPRVDFIDGVKEMAAFYRENKEHYWS